MGKGREEVGLPLPNGSYTMKVDPVTGTLLFDSNAVMRKKAGKNAEDMRELLYDRTGTGKEPLYEFFVGVAGKNDAAAIDATGLRYDVIVVFPGNVSGEFKKTSGHEHYGPYPEIYEVLHGTALFLVQKENAGRIEYFAAVEAGAGEKILVPPGYAHATVNIGSTPLVFSDLVADHCKNRYEGIQENHGMGYYVLDDDGTPAFERNANYREAPPVKRVQPQSRPELGLAFGDLVYDVLVKTPSVYAYLKEPERFMESIRYLGDAIEGKD